MTLLLLANLGNAGSGVVGSAVRRRGKRARGRAHFFGRDDLWWIVIAATLGAWV
jgi:hypothetical protein